MCLLFVFHTNPPLPILVDFLRRFLIYTDFLFSITLCVSFVIFLLCKHVRLTSGFNKLMMMMMNSVSQCYTWKIRDSDSLCICL